MISIASSLKFRKDDGLLPSPDNTFHADQVRPGGFKKDFYIPVYPTDSPIIQAKVLYSQTFDIQYSEDCWKTWTKYKDSTLKTTGPTYDYHEVVIDFADFSCKTVQFWIRILASNGNPLEDWYSEPVKILPVEDENLLLIEFFNNYLENEDNLFHVDYSTGITHQIRIYGTLLEYKAAGEVSVFDNQQELTKILGEVKRQMTLKTDPIPAYLAEMLWVAMQHDHFYINETEYVCEQAPEYENNIGGLAGFSVTLTQRTVLGLNAHDIGFQCDATTNSDTMVLQIEDASGMNTLAVPAGYMIGYISGVRKTGDPVIIAGRTPGGTDLLENMSLNSTDNIYDVADLGQKLNASDSGGSLYIGISGAGATADITVLIFKNIP